MYQSKDFTCDGKVIQQFATYEAFNCWRSVEIRPATIIVPLCDFQPTESYYFETINCRDFNTRTNWYTFIHKQRAFDIFFYLKYECRHDDRDRKCVCLTRHFKHLSVDSVHVPIALNWQNEVNKFKDELEGLRKWFLKVLHYGTVELIMEITNDQLSLTFMGKPILTGMGWHLDDYIRYIAETLNIPYSLEDSNITLKFGQVCRSYTGRTLYTGQLMNSNESLYRMQNELYEQSKIKPEIILLSDTGNEVGFHKCYLTASASYFKTYFDTQVGSSSNTIKTNFSTDVLFVYKNCLYNQDMGQASSDTIIAAIEFSFFYGVPMLAERLVQLLFDNISGENIREKLEYLMNRDMGVEFSEVMIQLGLIMNLLEEAYVNSSLLIYIPNTRSPKRPRLNEGTAKISTNSVNFQVSEISLIETDNSKITESSSSSEESFDGPDLFCSLKFPLYYEKPITTVSGNSTLYHYRLIFRSTFDQLNPVQQRYLEEWKNFPKSAQNIVDKYGVDHVYTYRLDSSIFNLTQILHDKHS